MIQEKIIITLCKIQKKFKKKETIFDYYDLLRELHSRLKPKTYLEIGIRNGVSLALAMPSTICYGVDPEPNIKVDLSEKTKIFSMTSDDFFGKYDELILDNKKIDFAFIDGMHLFDFVLRDFINTEKNCHKKSIITLHDTIPKDEITSRRIRETDHWTGDVYKIIPILKKYRPDLKILNTDIAPSGLTIIKNLNPKSTVLEDNYDKIVEEFMNMEYSEIDENKEEILGIKKFQKYKRFLRRYI